MTSRPLVFRFLISLLFLVIITPLILIPFEGSVFAQDGAPDNPSPDQAPQTYGPDLANFPPGFNPMTGLPVSDPANLELPAVLISITNFPASARPQAGPAFAPYIYEMFISEGMTRFLTIFYGDYPEPQQPIYGECPIRTEPFVKTNLILGNYIWHDSNGDGKQSLDENPISGVCVNLYAAENDELLDSTSTDSNGYFGFNVEADKKYYIKVVQPSGMEFTDQDIGEDDFADSDADPNTGMTTVFWLADDDYSWDIGFKGDPNNVEIPIGGEPGDGTQEGSSDAQTEAGQVTVSQENSTANNWKEPGQWIGNWVIDVIIGPVRSGRLPYKYLLEWFPFGCLIYAGKSAEVDIPGCASVFGSDKTDINSAFMSISRLKEIAKQSQMPGEKPDYSGNAYFKLPASNGKYSGPDLPGLVPKGDANQILMFYNFLNQALWKFDPLSGGYLRSTDLADGSGQFYPATDRLNGRQLIFHNVVILFARHAAITPTIIDIHLDYNQGPAILFRDGKAYQIIWNSYSDDQAKETGRNRPVKLIDANGNPVPLHPGQTWVHIVTQTTSAWEESTGMWRVRFYAPEGAK